MKQEKQVQKNHSKQKIRHQTIMKTTPTVIYYHLLTKVIKE